MGPKSKPICNSDPGVAGEATRQSMRSSRGIGGALRQLEYIQNHQTAPRVPQNKEAHRIQGKLDQQPNNLFAPSNKLRKTAKGSEVRGALYILDHRLTNGEDTPCYSCPTFSPSSAQTSCQHQGLVWFLRQQGFFPAPLHPVGQVTLLLGKRCILKSLLQTSTRFLRSC